MPGEVPKKASISTGLRCESSARSRGTRSGAATICCDAACWDFWDAAQAKSAAATRNTNAFIGESSRGHNARERSSFRKSGADLYAAAQLQVPIRDSQERWATQPDRTNPGATTPRPPPVD